MSDERHIDELEERAVQEAFEALERGDAGVSSRARPYLELLALLPAGLEPAEPSGRVKEALMAAARTSPSGRETGPPPSRRGLPAWALRVAAVVAVALLGISALQSWRIAHQEERIEAQEAQIERLQEELTEALPALDRPPAWMASSGTELCALRPRQAAGAAAHGRDSRGWLFIRRDHQHWYVAIEGLEPTPEDHVYEIWFVVEGELVSGGTFQPNETGRATLTSETMPNPVTGIAITLEPDDGDSVPSETTVLYGDEVMLVL